MRRNATANIHGVSLLQTTEASSDASLLPILLHPERLDHIRRLGLDPDMRSVRQADLPLGQRPRVLTMSIRPRGDSHERATHRIGFVNILRFLQVYSIELQVSCRLMETSRRTFHLARSAFSFSRCGADASYASCASLLLMSIATPSPFQRQRSRQSIVSSPVCSVRRRPILLVLLSLSSAHFNIPQLSLTAGLEGVPLFDSAASV